MNHLNIKQIEEILPHRHPFLLVDYIEDYEPGEFAVGYKCVTFRTGRMAGSHPKRGRKKISGRLCGDYRK